MKKATIPKNAKNVFSGVIFDVYQWKQKLFDGSYQTFEGIKRTPTVQIIAVTGTGKIVLLKEEQPYVGKFTSLIGGQVERGHTPLDTAKKELLEEAGIEAEKMVLWKVTSLGSKLNWETYYYIAKGCQKNHGENPDPGEKIKTYTVDFEKFLKETQREDFRNKFFSDMIFRIVHTEGELKKFKKMLFD